jgi:hypothetical protein
VSFFDDEGDEPPTRAARPRRPAGPRTSATGSRRRGGGDDGGPSDAQQLMVRRAVALGAGAIVLILIVLGVNGCLNSRANNALKSYTRDVNVILQDSDSQVSKRLFDLLSNASGSTVGLTQSVNQVRVTAAEDFRRAQALSTPSDMKDAQYHLLLALSLRSEGVEKIAAQLPNVTGNQKRTAVTLIAGDMRDFLASDVVISQRVDPYIVQVLNAHNIQGQTVLNSQFLPDDSWLQPDFVGSKLGVAGAASATSKTPAPGTHGHGLVDVKVGTATLQPAPATNRITATAATAFTVDFQNQGQNNEFDVIVRIAISGSGKTINVQKRVDQTNAGQPASTQIRLGTTPPIGVPVRVKVTIAPVPGESTTTNNTQTYVVIFTR